MVNLDADQTVKQTLMPLDRGTNFHRVGTVDNQPEEQMNRGTACLTMTGEAPLQERVA